MSSRDSWATKSFPGNVFGPFSPESPLHLPSPRISHSPESHSPESHSASIHHSSIQTAMAALESKTAIALVVKFRLRAFSANPIAPQPRWPLPPGRPGGKCRSQYRWKNRSNTSSCLFCSCPAPHQCRPQGKHPRNRLPLHIHPSQSNGPQFSSTSNWSARFGQSRWRSTYRNFIYPQNLEPLCPRLDAIPIDHRASVSSRGACPAVIQAIWAMARSRA